MANRKTDPREIRLSIPELYLVSMADGVISIKPKRVRSRHTTAKKYMKAGKRTKEYEELLKGW